MIQAGVDSATLAGILGHHSGEFTQRTYVHLFDNSKKEAMGKLEKIEKLEKEQAHCQVTFI